MYRLIADEERVEEGRRGEEGRLGVTQHLGVGAAGGAGWSFRADLMQRRLLESFTPLQMINLSLNPPATVDVCNFFSFLRLC